MGKSKKKTWVIISLVCVLLAVTIVGWIAFCGYFWNWGPFSKLHNIIASEYPGNAEKYDLEHVEPLLDSPLEGMNIAYLGSSVTYGASSMQISFVEYIAKRNNTTYTKETVSGTTLVAGGRNSYIARMERMDRAEDFDLFVCQLSTNDATQKKPLGEPKGANADAYDTKTVCGAIEYIIAYAQKTWDCPVVFYTNAYYESEFYADMVQALHEIAELHEIGVIDLYTDAQFNAVSAEQYELYMADAIHPTKAGYLEWWTPKMEEYLSGFAGK